MPHRTVVPHEPRQSGGILSAKYDKVECGPRPGRQNVGIAAEIQPLMTCCQLVNPGKALIAAARRVRQADRRLPAHP